MIRSLITRVVHWIWNLAEYFTFRPEIAAFHFVLGHRLKCSYGKNFQSSAIAKTGISAIGPANILI